eukprot:SAG11_NODE_25485_length_358_cov_0.795367_2_plen_40_part_01
MQWLTHFSECKQTQLTMRQRRIKNNTNSPCDNRKTMQLQL